MSGRSLCKGVGYLKTGPKVAQSDDGKSTENEAQRTAQELWIKGNLNVKCLHNWWKYKTRVWTKGSSTIGHLKSNQNKEHLPSDSGPIYTGPDKFLHGQKLTRFHLAFTRDRRNWTNIWTAKCASLGPEKIWSQTCKLSRSNIRPVPPVPCKRKVEPCKFLSVQIFVRTRVNGASVLELGHLQKS